MPFRLYKVDDGTGEVTVLSQGSRVPTRGARVRVRGRVDDVAVIIQYRPRPAAAGQFDTRCLPGRRGERSGHGR